MTNILAFDCAGRGCSAAVLLGDRVAAAAAEPMERGQAAALVPMIEAVLRRAAVELGDVDLVAVTVGPGGFTGLRIGIATARGLALAATLPALGITSFAAVAAGVPAPLRTQRRLVVALDSKREELFLQAFGADGIEEGAPAVLRPAEAVAWLPPGPLTLAGDAVASLAALVGDRAQVAPGDGLPDPAAIARLAAAAWRRGVRGPAPRPLYLRPPDTSQPRPVQPRPVQPRPVLPRRVLP